MCFNIMDSPSCRSHARTLSYAIVPDTGAAGGERGRRLCLGEAADMYGMRLFVLLVL